MREELLIKLFKSFPDKTIYVFDDNLIVKAIGGQTPIGEFSDGFHLKDALGNQIFNYLEYYILKVINEGNIIKINHQTKDRTYKETIYRLDNDHSVIITDDITDRINYQNKLLDSNRNLNVRDNQLHELSLIINHHIRSLIANGVSIYDLFEKGFYDHTNLIDDVYDLITQLHINISHISDILNIRLDKNYVSEIDLNEIISKISKSLEGELISSNTSIVGEFEYLDKFIFNEFSITTIFSSVIRFLIENTESINDRIITILSYYDDYVKLMFSIDSKLLIDANEIFTHKSFNSFSHSNLFLIKNQLVSMDSTMELIVKNNISKIVISIWEKTP